MSTIKALSDLRGRTALITGGAGHLGFTMAESLAEAGATVVLLDFDPQKTEQAILQLTERFGGSHHGLVVDLSDKSSIETVPEFLRSKDLDLSILINCAALVGTSGLKGWATPFEEQDIFTWEKALNVNLTGAFYLIQLCKPLMEMSQGASIINISSIYGVAGQKMEMYEGLGYLTPAAYAASKGGPCAAYALSGHSTGPLNSGELY